MLTGQLKRTIKSESVTLSEHLDELRLGADNKRVALTVGHTSLLFSRYQEPDILDGSYTEGGIEGIMVGPGDRRSENGLWVPTGASIARFTKKIGESLPSDTSAGGLRITSRSVDVSLDERVRINIDEIAQICGQTAARSLETISSKLTEDEAIQPLTWVEFNYGSDGEMIFRSLSNAGSPAVITNAAIPQGS